MHCCNALDGRFRRQTAALELNGARIRLSWSDRFDLAAENCAWEQKQVEESFRSAIESQVIL